MTEVRILDEFTLDFSGDFRIETEMDREGRTSSVPASERHIRLIDKDMTLGCDDFYIDVHQLLEIVESGRKMLVLISPLEMMEQQQWMHMTPQEAMSVSCKWMNSKLRRKK